MAFPYEKTNFPRARPISGVGNFLTSWESWNLSYQGLKTFSTSTRSESRSPIKIIYVTQTTRIKHRRFNEGSNLLVTSICQTSSHMLWNRHYFPSERIVTKTTEADRYGRAIRTFVPGEDIKELITRENDSEEFDKRIDIKTDTEIDTKDEVRAITNFQRQRE